MTRPTKTLVLTLAGFSIRYDGLCYVLTRRGDRQGKSNTYHPTLDGAIVSLFEKVLPERVAQRPDYHASMAELVQIVREVREELRQALSLTAGNRAGRENAENRIPDMAEGQTSRSRGVGA